MGLKSPVDVLKQGIARAGAGIYDKDAVVNVVNGYTASSGSKKLVVFSWTRCVNELATVRLFSRSDPSCVLVARVSTKVLRVEHTEVFVDCCANF